jgi:hypothetical protein
MEAWVFIVCSASKAMSHACCVECGHNWHTTSFMIEYHVACKLYTAHRAAAACTDMAGHQGVSLVCLSGCDGQWRARRSSVTQRRRHAATDTLSLF